MKTLAAALALSLIAPTAAQAADDPDYKVVQRHIDAMANKPMNTFVLRMTIGDSVDLGPLDGSAPPAPSSAASYIAYAKALPSVAGAFSDAECGLVANAEHEVECKVQFTSADGKTLEQTQRYTVEGKHIVRILTGTIRPVGRR